MELRNKKILVTGGAGFIGSHLVDALAEEDPAAIIVVDNFFLGKKENLSKVQGSFKNLKIIEQDATDYSEMKKIIRRNKIEVVFNLATKALEYSFVNPDDAYMVNVNLASVLLRLLNQKAYKTLIHCSSSEAYGSKEKGLIDESHAFDPETLYAAGKASADLMIRSYYKTYNLDIATVRPFNNFGPRQNDKQYSAVIPITIKRILQGKAPVVHGDGNQTRDFIYVTDTARALVDVYKNIKTRGKEINIATGKETKIKDLIKLIAKKMAFNGNIIYKPARIADIKRHKASTKLALKILNFKPKISFDEGMEKTIQWYLSNEKNSSNKTKN